MKKKVLLYIEILLSIFLIFYVYNQAMYIVNKSKIETKTVTDKFKIRNIEFYQGK